MNCDRIYKPTAVNLGLTDTTKTEKPQHFALERVTTIAAIKQNILQLKAVQQQLLEANRKVAAATVGNGRKKGSAKLVTTTGKIEKHKCRLTGVGRCVRVP
jgi:hypothetical protein